MALKPLPPLPLATPYPGVGAASRLRRRAAVTGFRCVSALPPRRRGALGVGKGDGDDDDGGAVAVVAAVVELVVLGGMGGVPSRPMAPWSELERPWAVLLCFMVVR